jgi:hypothetical protein
MMQIESMSSLSPRDHQSTDHWIRRPGLIGYRASNVVARLDDLPDVYPEHMYFHLLLLDAGGRLQDSHSGPCHSLARQRPQDEKCRFVRVVAELVRHAPSEDRGLSTIGNALSLVRERGVHTENLVLVTQALDDACTESAVVASLKGLLELSLGRYRAARAICDVVQDLARTSRLDAPCAVELQAPPGDISSRVNDPDNRYLETQVAYIVRMVGKSRARRFLRETIDLELVPVPLILGL